MGVLVRSGLEILLSGVTTALLAYACWLAKTFGGGGKDDFAGSDGERDAFGERFEVNVVATRKKVNLKPIFRYWVHRHGPTMEREVR